MYSTASYKALKRAMNSKWDRVNLNAIPLKTLFLTYLKVYVELTHASSPDNLWIDMDDYVAELSGSEMTLPEWLVSIGDRALNHVAPPRTEAKFIKYEDAFRAQYRAEPVKAGYIMPAGTSIYDLPDVKLTRPGYSTDMRLIHSHCLVTVNGYVHMTDADNETAFVYKANESLVKSNHNQLGIISFLDIGELTKVRLKKEDLFNANVDQTLKDTVYFTVPNNTDNKCFFMVLGGYLVFPRDGLLWKVNDNTYALNLNQLPYLERLFESDMYMKLDIGLQRSHINEDLINVDNAHSDEVIKNYFTMSQSFFVIVDVPRLHINQISIEHCNLPGVFTCYQDPKYPLVVNYGKLAEYWKTYDDGYWNVSVQDSFVRNYILSSVPAAYLANVTPAVVPDDRYIHSTGHLLEIVGYQI